MGTKQLAEDIGFVEQLGYPSGPLFLGAGKMIICTTVLTTWRQCQLSEARSDVINYV